MDLDELIILMYPQLKLFNNNYFNILSLTYIFFQIIIYTDRHRCKQIYSI